MALHALSISQLFLLFILYPIWYHCELQCLEADWPMLHTTASSSPSSVGAIAGHAPASDPETDFRNTHADLWQVLQPCETFLCAEASNLSGLRQQTLMQMWQEHIMNAG